MELLGDVGHVESRFGPFGGSVTLDTRWCTICTKSTIGSEIIFLLLLGNHFGRT
jgi:hypothetical protein